MLSFLAFNFFLNPMDYLKNKRVVSVGVCVMCWQQRRWGLVMLPANNIVPLVEMGEAICRCFGNEALGLNHCRQAFLKLCKSSGRSFENDCHSCENSLRNTHLLLVYSYGETETRQNSIQI